MSDFTWFTQMLHEQLYQAYIKARPFDDGTATTLATEAEAPVIGRYDGVRFIENAGKPSPRLLPEELARKWSKVLAAAKPQP